MTSTKVGKFRAVQRFSDKTGKKWQTSKIGNSTKIQSRQLTRFFDLGQQIKWHFFGHFRVIGVEETYFFLPEFSYNFLYVCTREVTFYFWRNWAQGNLRTERTRQACYLAHVGKYRILGSQQKTLQNLSQPEITLETCAIKNISN